MMGWGGVGWGGVGWGVVTVATRNSWGSPYLPASFETRGARA